MRRLLVIGVFVLLAGCGGGADDQEATAPDESAAPGASTTSVSVPAQADSETNGVEDGEVTDARVVAEFYANTALAWGEQGFDLQAMAEGTASTYPDLSLSGSAVPADPTTVSAGATLLDDKDVPGDDNPGIVAFAVRDVGGTCIGAVAVGHPAPTEILRLQGEAGDECTADEMIEAVRTDRG